MDEKTYNEALKITMRKAFITAYEEALALKRGHEIRIYIAKRRFVFFNDERKESPL